jgi:hypothetical protein
LQAFNALARHGREYRLAIPDSNITVGVPMVTWTASPPRPLGPQPVTMQLRGVPSAMWKTTLPAVLLQHFGVPCEVTSVFAPRLRRNGKTYPLMQKYCLEATLSPAPGCDFSKLPSVVIVDAARSFSVQVFGHTTRPARSMPARPQGPRAGTAPALPASTSSRRRTRRGGSRHGSPPPRAVGASGAAAGPTSPRMGVTLSRAPPPALPAARPAPSASLPGSFVPSPAPTSAFPDTAVARPTPGVAVSAAVSPLSGPRPSSSPLAAAPAAPAVTAPILLPVGATDPALPRVGERRSTKTAAAVVRPTASPGVRPRPGSPPSAARGALAPPVESPNPFSVLSDGQHTGGLTDDENGEDTVSRRSQRVATLRAQGKLPETYSEEAREAHIPPAI